LLEYDVSEKDVIIIGAGLTGVMAAWQLNKRGHNVTVLDAREGPALETSFANAGALTSSQPEPWNQPGVFWQLLASFFDPHAPMKLRLAPLPGLITWGLRFLRNSTHARYKKASLANFELSRHSLQLTQQTGVELGISFDNHRIGTLKLCADQATLDAAISNADLLVSKGLNYKALNQEQTIALVPQLSSVKDTFVGSVHFPDDESGDAKAYTQSLKEAAEKAGVSFEWNTKVMSLMDRGGDIIGVYTENEEIEADVIIVAAGHAAWTLLKPHGLHLPVRPVKGYSITLDMSDVKNKPEMPIVHERLHAMATPMGNRLRVAGTAEIAGNNKTIQLDRIENLKTMVKTMYPDFADQILQGDLQAWAGLRPISADGRPFIGETRAPGLWLTTGHGHLGWTQAMGSADLLGAMIDGEDPAIDPTPFSAKRF
jgi:D-amino-acid dehydrogenase